MIGILDYGCGNLRSLENALEALGLDSRRVAAAEELDALDRLIQPGVGHFGHAMTQLRKRELEGAVKAFAASGRPMLGICLGMQLMFEGSEEAPEIEGLGLLPGRFELFRGRSTASAEKPSLRMPRTDESTETTWESTLSQCPLLPQPPLQPSFPLDSPPPLKVPHMGWSTVDFGDRAGTAYFVHSYFLPEWDPRVPQERLGIARYGRPFVAAFRSGNLGGCQFHPEKSGAWGLALLKEMLAW